MRAASERFVIYALGQVLLSSAVLPFGVPIDEGNSLCPAPQGSAGCSWPRRYIYIQPLYLVDEEFFRDVTSSKLSIRKSHKESDYGESGGFVLDDIE